MSVSEITINWSITFWQRTKSQIRISLTLKCSPADGLNHQSWLKTHLYQSPLSWCIISFLVKETWYSLTHLNTFNDCVDALSEGHILKTVKSFRFWNILIRLLISVVQSRILLFSYNSKKMLWQMFKQMFSVHRICGESVSKI